MSTQTGEVLSNLHISVVNFYNVANSDISYFLGEI